MKTRNLFVWIGLGLLVLALSGTALARGTTATGGQLYDTWWTVLGLQPPEGDHPLWAEQHTNPRHGADTWRCKECHGWDYRGKDGAYGPGSDHYTGFPGILDAVRRRSLDDLLADLQGRTDPRHDFSTVMDEASLRALATFLKDALADPTQVIAPDGSVRGDADHGEVLFSQVCAACHGQDGRAFNFATVDAPEYLGTLARDNPWEVLHKIRFGQPGTDMPAGVDAGWTLRDAADVLAYLQTLPGEKADPDLARGAALYDHWMAATGQEAPPGSHPLYPATGRQQGAATWRCKECHGWDYKGKDGAYGRPESSHYTGFRGVMGMQGRSTDQALAWLTGQNNPDHDFSAYLNTADLNALARFLTEGLVDDAQLIAADGTALGDPQRGHMLFNATCAYCHGKDGTAINFGDEAGPEYLGTIARENPWEFVHKVRGGQPGTPMPAGLARGWETQFAADVLAYAQSLPLEPIADDIALGGALYDKWFAVLGQEPPPGDNPLWARQTTNTRSGGDTWRCVECHGWDYKGKDGAYGRPESSHYTGFPGLMAAIHTRSVEELVAILQGAQDPAHDFSPYLAPEHLLALARFLKYGHVNDDDFIDDLTMRAVGGDMAHGQALFDQVCANCHGADGTAIQFFDEGYVEYIGTVAVEDPWEFLHKARFGTPGTDMPQGYLLGWTEQDARDILRYAQTLPTGQESPAQSNAATQAAPVEPTPPGGPARTWWSGIGTALAAFGAAVGVNLLVIGVLVGMVFLVMFVWRRQG